MWFFIGIVFLAAFTLLLLRDLASGEGSRLKAIGRWAQNVLDSLWGMQ